MAGTIKKLYLSEGVSVTAPTELTFTGLGSYANDAAWVTANGTAVEGAMYVNTTLEVVRYYANSAWRSVLGASDPTDATKVLAIDVSGNTTGVTATLDFNATANRTYTFPNASMTVVGADTAQVLTAKDYDGGTASDTSRLTIPKAGTATLSALTRKEGTVVFDTDLDKPYYDNGSALVAFGSGAGGGGEKTYITNPSAADAITGWNAVGDLAVARSTTLAELPREFTTATGIKITADADVQSVADYVYYDFTLDDVDLSKKLKIQWSQKVTGTYTAGQLAVVITTQADRTTALHTPITTAIPASDGVFITSFDASTTATLSLVIRATADMTTSGGIVISDVIVGPGLITQGAVVSSLGTFAATASAGFGTVTGSDIKAWRIGNILRVKGRWANGTVAASTGSIDLPSGHTIDTSLLSTAASGTVVGGYTTTSSGGSVGLYSGGYSGVVFFDGSDTNTLFFGLNSAANAYTKSNVSGVLSGSSAPWDFEFSIPIAEWAGGSGTVNLATSESMGLPAVYEYTNWTPSGTGSTSTTPSAGSVTSTNAGITFSGPSSGTVTATINTQGYYQVSASVYHTHTNVYSDARFSCIFGGTASRRGLNSTTLAMAPGIDAQDVNNSQTVVYTVYATPGQTVTFQPTYISNGIAAAVDHTAYASLMIQPLSAIGQAVGFGAATASSMGLTKAPQVFAAYGTANQTGVASGAITKMTIDTEEFDSSSVFDSATNYRFQPTVSGKYLMTWGVQIRGSASNAVSDAHSYLYKNGAEFKRGAHVAHSTTAIVNIVESTGSAIIDMNGTSDYLELYADGVVSSGTVTFNGGQTVKYFSGTKVAE